MIIDQLKQITVTSDESMIMTAALTLKVPSPHMNSRRVGNSVMGDLIKWSDGSLGFVLTPKSLLKRNGDKIEIDAPCNWAKRGYKATYYRA